ncbi:hypothetical protein GN958_ATG07032 [Phytophthora infestans]|uniref:Uncharacterized protein n=1 Tax=Phytophthora infestans TaxID=4787 RepID=A0A8S9UST5_PHYIN|nr:hypothetical protein GN958_ATG07032 [Phytophthora infestans]
MCLWKTEHVRDRIDTSPDTHKSSLASPLPAPLDTAPLDTLPPPLDTDTAPPVERLLTPPDKDTRPAAEDALQQRHLNTASSYEN